MSWLLILSLLYREESRLNISEWLKPPDQPFLAVMVSHLAGMNSPYLPNLKDMQFSIMASVHNMEKCYSYEDERYENRFDRYGLDLPGISISNSISILDLSLYWKT